MGATFALVVTDATKICCDEESQITEGMLSATDRFFFRSCRGDTSHVQPNFVKIVHPEW